jgi:hypothetical protein
LTVTGSECCQRLAPPSVHACLAADPIADEQDGPFSALNHLWHETVVAVAVWYLCACTCVSSADSEQRAFRQKQFTCCALLLS